MPAPTVTLPTTGSAPKLIRKSQAEAAINSPLSILYDLIATASSGLTPKGNWDASAGSFPSGGALGDFWIVNVAGTVDGEAFVVGDWLLAITASPSTSVYAANWARAAYGEALASFVIPGQEYSIDGDGRTTGYDLVSAPDNLALLDVTVDGVRQVKDTHYTVVVSGTAASGWAIQFVDPGTGEVPQTGQTIWVRYFRAFRSTNVEAGSFPDGNVTTPGANFLLDTNTGFYRPGVDQIGMVTGGAQRVLLGTTNLTTTVPVFDTAFPTRAAFVTWLAVSGNVVPNGTVVYAGPLAYIGSTGATDISDMPGVVPLGDIRVWHFASNTTPGTTDMAQAIRDAAAYSKSKVGADGTSIDQLGRIKVWFGPEIFYVGSTVKFDSTYDGLELVPDGAIIVTDLNDVLFRIGDDDVFSADAAGTSTVYNVRIKGFRFRNTNLTSDASIAIQLGRTWNTHVKENAFWNFWVGISNHAIGHHWITDNNFYIRGRTTTVLGGVRWQGIYDSTNSYTPGAGCHFHNNEFSGNPDDASVVTQAWHIQSIDGFYFGGNHAQHIARTWNFEPTGSADNYRNNVLTDIRSMGGNYCDNPATNSTQIRLGGTVAYAGTTGQANGQYEDIKFALNDFVRGANEANYGVIVSVTDGGGFAAARGGLHGISLPLNYENHKVVAIQVQGADSSKLECIGLDLCGAKFVGGRSGQTADTGTSCAIIEARSVMASNMTIGKETVAPLRAFSFNLSGALSEDEHTIMFNYNDHSASLYSREMYSLDAEGGGQVEIVGNIEKAGGGRRYISRRVAKQTNGLVATILADYPVGTTNSLVDVTARCVGRNTPTSSTLGRYASLTAELLVERTGASASVVLAPTQTLTKSAGWGINEHPAILTMLTGTTWTSSMSVAVGDMIVNSAGDVFLVIESDGTAGATEPTEGTSGNSIDGVRYLYVAEEDVNKVVLIAGSETDQDIQWFGDLTARQAG